MYVVDLIFFLLMLLSFLLLNIPHFDNRRSTQNETKPGCKFYYHKLRYLITRVIKS